MVLGVITEVEEEEDQIIKLGTPTIITQLLGVQSHHLEIIMIVIIKVVVGGPCNICPCFGATTS